MKIFFILSFLVLTTKANYACDLFMSGEELLNSREESIKVLVGDKFVELHSIRQKIEKSLEYSVFIKHDYKNYDRSYVKYYGHEELLKLLEKLRPQVSEIGYEIVVVGQSVEGRDLYSLRPIQNDHTKKTIVMTGRHHGDEGSANWIIEGFLEKALNDADFLNNYQLFLYPMINPDGAEEQVRYNSNGYDLNRVWHQDIQEDKDEVFYIHKDLDQLLKFDETLSTNVPIVLDMHGSFYEDFIFRVERNYIDTSFYDLQQSFIDELKLYDPWQNGSFQHSNGHPNMFRIFFVKHFGVNAMTHESVRNVPLSSGRTIETLKSQGAGIYQSIVNLYSHSLSF